MGFPGGDWGDQRRGRGGGGRKRLAVHRIGRIRLLLLLLLLLLLVVRLLLELRGRLKELLRGIATLLLAGCRSSGSGGSSSSRRRRYGGRKTVAADHEMLNEKVLRDD